MSRDLFNRSSSKARDDKAQAEQERTNATPSWRKAQLGRRTELLGRGYSNIDLAEQMSVACVGLTPDRTGSMFIDALATAMSNHTVTYRVWRTDGEAPARLEGTERLTSRAQTEARRILALGEARGENPIAFPFTPTLIKAGSSGHCTSLHHGQLVVERGFDMALIGTERARRLSTSDFPGLPLTGSGATRSSRNATGLPLVIGSSIGAASWALLSERGALAVWCGTHLWTFLALEPFAAPLDALRARVAPRRSH